MVLGRFYSALGAGDWKVNDIISKDPLTDEEIYEAENKWRIFDYTDAEETFTLPNNISNVNIYLWGAGGGSGGSQGKGGAGALVYGNLSVLNVTELKITVGEGGHKWGNVYDGTVFGGG